MKKWILPFSIIICQIIIFGTGGYFFFLNKKNSEKSLILKQKIIEGQDKLKLKEAILGPTLSPTIEDVLYLISKTNLDENSDFSILKDDLIHFSKSRKDIDQIRFLDTTGQETFRVNKNNGEIEIVSQHLLQDKSKRDYFKQSIHLNKNEIYISELDLNVEHGKVELPIKPTIRLATCLFRNDKVIGELVVNYNMTNFLHSFQNSENLSADYFLVRNDYKILASPENKGAFSFMFDDDNKTVFTEFPYLNDLNPKVKNSKTKNEQINIIHFVKPYEWYNKLNLRGTLVTHEENEWGLIYHLPEKELVTSFHQLNKAFEQNLINLSIFIGLFAIVIVLIWKKRIDQFQQLETANLELEGKIKERTYQLNEKINHITDSLKYAKKIQQAMFPEKKLIRKYFKKSFLFYKPKDIVSGDFYWMSVGENQDEIFFAIADCTGHGVPGAIVSMICINSLNTAVQVEKLSSPKAIMYRVGDLINHAFSQSDENKINDGMDISLCVLNLKTRKITWTGANLPLWIVKTIDNEQKLIETSGTRVGIRGNEGNIIHDFNEHTYELTPNDVIYFFTDGYRDQFNGKTDKKMGRNTFRDVILETSKFESMEDQHEYLITFFNNWKADSPQIDDVSVFGIRIS